MNHCRDFVQCLFLRLGMACARKSERKARGMASKGDVTCDRNSERKSDKPSQAPGAQGCGGKIFGRFAQGWGNVPVTQVFYYMLGGCNLSQCWHGRPRCFAVYIGECSLYQWRHGRPKLFYDVHGRAFCGQLRPRGRGRLVGPWRIEFAPQVYRVGPSVHTRRATCLPRS